MNTKELDVSNSHNHKHYHYAKFTIGHNVIEQYSSWIVNDVPDIDTVISYLSDRERSNRGSVSSAWADPALKHVPGTSYKAASNQAAVVLTADDDLVWVIIEDEADVDPKALIKKALNMR